MKPLTLEDFNEILQDALSAARFRYADYYNLSEENWEKVCNEFKRKNVPPSQSVVFESTFRETVAPLPSKRQRRRLRGKTR
jgi:hypothetical protein